MTVVIWIAVALGVVLLVVGLAVAGLYNKLVVLQHRWRNAFSQIDVQLKRRHDLIPNLVEVAKGYMKHERETLEAVIQARNQAASAGEQAAQDPSDSQAMTSLGHAEGQLAGALGRLFVVFERYPELQANQNMLSLQEELTSTENKVAFARQAYNDAVMRYNTAREAFPTVLLVDAFRFQEANLFDVERPQDREAARASFG